MNYIKQVANMLGVEIGQEFNIILSNGNPSECNPYHFEEDRLCSREKDFTEPYLCRLITRKCTIEIIPFKPKCGEIYYYIGSIEGNICSCVFDVKDTSDLIYWKAGNCFRTEEEARTKGRQFMEQLLYEYNNES